MQDPTLNNSYTSIDGINCYWVKKAIPAKEWFFDYNEKATYCFLKKISRQGIESEKAVVGFLAVDTIPYDCELLNDDELFIVDNYRKARNISPRPFFECESAAQKEHKQKQAEDFHSLVESLKLNFGGEK